LFCTGLTVICVDGLKIAQHSVLATTPDGRDCSLGEECGGESHRAADSRCSDVSRLLPWWIAVGRDQSPPLTAAVRVNDVVDGWAFTWWHARTT